MGHDHKHHHHHHHSHDGESNIGIAFLLNISFTIIELIGGYMTNSVAIISDAVHDFGDSISLGMAWYFQKISKREKTDKYTYGYKRFSLLGAIINSIVLVVGSIYIISEAVPRLFSPQETSAKGMFALAIVGIIINGAAVLKTRTGDSINERVVSLHMMEDVLGWAAVLIGSAIMHFTGLTIIDPILSIGIAGFVLFNVYGNIKDVLPILLQGTPEHIDLNHIVEHVMELGEVEEVHDIHIWSLDEEYNIMTIHVVLKDWLEEEKIVKLKSEIRSILEDEGVQHSTIEFESKSENFRNII